MTVRKHIVRWSGSVFDCPDATFDIRYVFILCCCVETWEQGSQWFKLIVPHYCADGKSTWLVEFHNILKLTADCGNSSVWENFNCDEFDMPWDGDEERNFVNEHDINTQSDGAERVQYLLGNWINIVQHMLGNGSNRLSFKWAKVWSKNIICSCDVLNPWLNVRVSRDLNRWPRTTGFSGHKIRYRFSPTF